jgi:hypothetical protein
MLSVMPVDGPTELDGQPAPYGAVTNAMTD